VTLEFGASVGALTIIDRNLSRGQIAFGNPLQILRFKRDCDRLAALEAELEAREAQ
jgi:acetyltransferase-like isoleucine patch superfamily enzyme